jgi:hypothetical protein
MPGPAHAAAAAHVPPVQMPPQQPQMQPQLPQMQPQSITGPPTAGPPHYMPDSYQAGPSHQPVYTNSNQMYQSISQPMDTGYTPAVPQPAGLRTSRRPPLQLPYSHGEQFQPNNHRCTDCSPVSPSPRCHRRSRDWYSSQRDSNYYYDRRPQSHLEAASYYKERHRSPPVQCDRI